MNERDFDAVLANFRKKAAQRIAEFEATLDKSHRTAMTEAAKVSPSRQMISGASTSTWGAQPNARPAAVRTVLRRGM